MFGSHFSLSSCFLFLRMVMMQCEWLTTVMNLNKLNQFLCRMHWNVRCSFFVSPNGDWPHFVANEKRKYTILWNELIDEKQREAICFDCVNDKVLMLVNWQLMNCWLFLFAFHFKRLTLSLGCHSIMMYGQVYGMKDRSGNGNKKTWR